MSCISNLKHLNLSGIPSPREQVIGLVKDLVNLRLPHLHICVTSRPEFDIRATLGPLALRKVSLHDQSGQKKDIVDYVHSVVYSDSETMMKRWRDEDKKMVVEALSEKADGMFRWVFCQLDTLRQCLPQCVRRTLNELPETLDKTYERVVMEIKKANQAHAYRMLQCLTVAVRPLSVAELAELLAFDFDVAKGGIPELNSDWRWEDHEQAVLSTCSSLITIVPNDESPVVQFSHFSVKEFLMSDRLATSTGDISQYHISLEDAHTVLARACLGVLLRDPNVENDAKSAPGPLAQYAAEHWVTHARVENVASQVRDGMKQLFDSDRPYFEAWVKLHDADADYDYGKPDAEDMKPGARPLYYAALCGFHELVEQLILKKHPQHASAQVGCFGTTLHSASFAGHLQIVRSFLRNGVDVDVRDHWNGSPLQWASIRGHCDIVQCLLDYGADVNLQDVHHDTPLIMATRDGHLNVVRALLEHNANVHAQSKSGWTPSHFAIRASHNSKGDYPRIVQLLLEHSADVGAEEKYGNTPLQVALEQKKSEIARLLSEYRSERPQI
ncbi:ankyrin repeat-containing domain protein [Lactarius deliciosus]|nr:ankyrin repeat-containing domain protein [Lactarius deliciosus]